MEDPVRGQTAPVGETKDHKDRANGATVPTDQTKGSEIATSNGAPTSSDKHQADVPIASLPQKKRRNRRRNRKSHEQKLAHAAASDAPNAPEKTQGSERQNTGKHHQNKQQQNKQHQNRQVGAQSQQLYAALDLGTNNCRLLIARPTRAGQFHVVDAFSRIVRLGEGLAASGELSQGAMDRAISALQICASKLARHNIKKYRLIATEACRQASNGAQFLERVKRETGLNLELINRETEAQLAVSGCASLVEPHTKSIVLFDIGGGSSEIAAINFENKRTPRLANHIKSWTSLPVGVVTLSERHGGQNVTPAIFDAMVEEVEALFEETAPQALRDFEPDLDNFYLLGTSGTVTTLAGIFLQLPRYDRRRVDGLWLLEKDVDDILKKLLSWDLDERSENPCIGPDRSDLVLAGCAIMQAIRNKWPSRKMRVADRGLREGLLNDMMAKDGVWRRRRRHNGRNNGRPNDGQNHPQNHQNARHKNRNKDNHQHGKSNEHSQD